MSESDLKRLRRENVDLKEQLEQERRERDELYVMALRYLAVALDAKDEYTRGHSQRVTLFARALTRHLEVPEKEPLIGRVTLAGQLHDVGKVWVPDAVLKKNTKLNPSEWYEMKQHPILGEYLISSSLLLEDIRDGVRGHHERVDGGGYPDKLAGDEIPLISRIICVCDAFDAMTLARVYRPTVRTDTEALKELRRCQGSQFDRQMVDAFAQAMENGEILLARGEYFETEQEPGSWETAARCYQHALETIDPANARQLARVQLQLGRLLAQQRRKGAIGHLQQALVGDPDPSFVAEVKVELALAHYNCGDYDKTLRVCDEVAQTDLEQRSARQMARLAHFRGLVHARRKERRRAMTYLELAENTFRSMLDDLRDLQLHRDPWRLLQRFDEIKELELCVARVCDSKANVYLDQGDANSAILAAHSSLDIKTRYGDFYGSAISLSTLGLINMCRGVYEEAQGSLEQALRISQMVNDRGGQNVVRNRLAELLVRRNQRSRAIEHLHQALALAEQEGREVAKRFSCLGLARAFVADGNAAQALSYANLALSAPRVQHSELGALACMARAQAKSMLDDASGAEQDFASAEEVLEQLDVPWEELELKLRYAEFLKQQGRLGEAQAKLERARKLADGLGDNWLDLPS